MPQRERLEQKRIEVEEMRVNRELRHLKYQEQQEKAERRAAALLERQAQAEQHAQARRHQEQLRLEEAREAAALEQDSLEAEARDSHLQWEVDWLDHTLNHLLPSDLPPTFELEVHKAVAELLAKLDAHQPEKLTKRLVQAAIDKALQPWRKQKEIEKIIEEARNQLPPLARSSGSTPNEWEARAMRDAADAIAHLDKAAPLAAIRAVAVEAGNKVCTEYQAWKAADDHRKACKHIMDWTFEGDDACEAVRRALERLPVGTTGAQMETVKDAALAPFRAATKAVEDADLYLYHVIS